MLIVGNNNNDLVFRMAFHATRHPVEMHNKVWLSSRALELLKVHNPSMEKAIQAITMSGHNIDAMSAKIRQEIAAGGCDPAGFSDDVAEMLVIWMNQIYQKYYEIRKRCVPDELNISEDNKKDLMVEYCQLLKSDPVVQDYWVRLFHGKQILDNREMKA